MSMPLKKRGDGRSVLVAAARLEFEEFGFEGTNSNAIARRAGYAPQTFYRHFQDKRAIFLAVYEDWSRSEFQTLEAVRTASQFADTVIQHHRTHRVFRQSLRYLSVTDPLVSATRARARQVQIAGMCARLAVFAAMTASERVTTILTIERICDAIVDGEYAALDVDPSDSRRCLVDVLQKLGLPED